MAESYLEYNEKGFWVLDPEFEIASAVMYCELRTITVKEEWQVEFIDLVKANAEFGFGGFMNWGFERFFVTDERKRWLVHILETILLKIESGKIYDLEYFDAIKLRSCRGDSWITRSSDKERYNRQNYLKIMSEIFSDILELFSE